MRCACVQVACGRRWALHLFAKASAIPVWDIVGLSVFQYGVAPMRLPWTSLDEGCVGPTALIVSGLSIKYWLALRYCSEPKPVPSCKQNRRLGCCVWR